VEPRPGTRLCASGNGFPARRAVCELGKRLAGAESGFRSQEKTIEREKRFANAGSDFTVQRAASWIISSLPGTYNDYRTRDFVAARGRRSARRDLSFLARALFGSKGGARRGGVRFSGRRPESPEIRAMQMTWADKIEAKGMMKGRKEAREEAADILRRTVIRQIGQRFGEVPARI
jgi:hypothetical protein